MEKNISKCILLLVSSLHVCFMHESLLLLNDHTVETTTDSITTPNINGTSISNRTVYASRGDNVTLPCHVEASSQTAWDGPSIEGTFKTSPYADGQEINQHLTDKHRLTIVGNRHNGEYNLQISNMSSKDEGLYKCFETSNGAAIVQERRVNLKLKVPPSNITINTLLTHRTVEATENKTVTLMCNVNSGVPSESISWHNSSSVLKIGGPGSLNISFVVERKSHKTEYTCKVTSSALENPLHKTIKLDVKYKPVVEFARTYSAINEGKNWSIVCTSDANPIATSLSMRKDGLTLLHCDNNSSLHYSVKNISRTYSGKYTCTAKNDIGLGENFTSLVVHYPPDLNISQFKDDGSHLILECNAQGVPNTYTFSWEHRSDYDEYIQSLNNTKKLKLPSDGIGGENFKRNGIYVCKCGNGIRNSYGQLQSLQSTTVKLEGKPVFAPFNIKINYGYFQNPVEMKVHYFSHPKPVYPVILKNGSSFTDIHNFLSEKEIKVKNKINGLEVHMHGYELALKIPSLTVYDFTSYEFKLENKHGSSNYVIRLVSVDIPQIPEDPQVIQVDKGLQVTWVSSFNGGYHQQFFVEFKRKHDSHWKTEGPIRDSRKKKRLHLLEDLIENSDYMIRIYANNSVGRSNSTETIVARLLSPTKNEYNIYIRIGIICSSLLAFIVIGICLVLKTGQSFNLFKVHLFSRSEVDVRENQEVDTVSLTNMATDNLTYESYFTRSNQTFHLRQQADESNHIMQAVGVQAACQFVQTQKDEDTAAFENVVYETQGDVLNGRNHQNTLMHSNHSGPSTWRDVDYNREYPSASMIKENGNCELHYAELEFETTEPNITSRWTDKTIYSEVDFGATTDLSIQPNSHPSKTDDENDDDDDFVCIEGLAEYMEKIVQSHNKK